MTDYSNPSEPRTIKIEVSRPRSLPMTKAISGKVVGMLRRAGIPFRHRRSGLSDLVIELRWSSDQELRFVFQTIRSSGLRIGVVHPPTE